MDFECSKHGDVHDPEALYDIGFYNVPKEIVGDVVEYLMKAYKFFKLKAEASTLEVDI